MQTEDRKFNQYQQQLTTALNPVTTNPINTNNILMSVSLSSSGANTVPHKLGRPLVGWFIVGQDSQASIWDSQASNPHPAENLILNTSANVTVNLCVF